MRSIQAFILAIVAGSMAVPVVDEPHVEVYRDHLGNYKYSFTSINITITEDRRQDGYVSGSYSYIDDAGIRQTVQYTAGEQGFVASGSSIPVNTDLPVVDLPEVEEARRKHLQISEAIKQLLPELKEGEELEEAPIVSLTNDELLGAIDLALNPKFLQFSADTPEIAEAKAALIEAYKAALVY